MKERDEALSKICNDIYNKHRTALRLIFENVKIEEGAVVEYSLVMPGAVVKKGAHVQYAIVAENTVIGEGSVVGENPQEIENRDDWGIAVVGSGVKVGKKAVVKAKSMISKNVKEGETV